MDKEVIVAILGLIGVGITIVCSIFNVYLTVLVNRKVEIKIRRCPLYVSVSYFTKKEIYNANKTSKNLILSNDFSKNLESETKYIFVNFFNPKSFFFLNVSVKINNETFDLGYIAPDIKKIIPIKSNQDLVVKIEYNSEYNEKFTQEIEYQFDIKKIIRNETYLHRKFRKILISKSTSTGVFMTIDQFKKY